MKVINKKKIAVTLFGICGEVFPFDSMEAALDALGFSWISYSVKKEFRKYEFEPCCCYGIKDCFYRGVKCPGFSKKLISSRWVLRNEFGEALTAEDFLPLFAQRCSDPRKSRRFQYWDGTGPVPRIRKSRGGRHYWRRLHVANELRRALPMLEEGEAAPRAERSANNLPDSRDGYSIAARKIRNWKRFRKHQWK